MSVGFGGQQSDAFGADEEDEKPNDDEFMRNNMGGGAGMGGIPSFARQQKGSTHLTGKDAAAEPAASPKKKEKDGRSRWGRNWLSRREKPTAALETRIVPVRTTITSPLTAM